MRLILFTAAWLLGILLGRSLWQGGALGCATPAWSGLALAALALGLWALLRRRRPGSRWGVALVFLALLVLGAWRYQLQPLAACAGPGTVAYYQGGQDQASWVTVEGWVSADPDVRDQAVYYRVRAVRLARDGQTREVAGDVQVVAPRWPLWRYGDRLAITGTLEAPPRLAGFDYPAYLAQQGIFSRLRGRTITRLGGGQGSALLKLLYDLRGRGVALIDRSLPEPAAALADGMLLGVEGSIPTAVDEAFKATGTAHVIVISGSNIALLSGYLLAGLARLLGRRWAALSSLIVIAAYVTLAGGDASAVRAGIMAAVYIGAILAGRQGWPLLSLGAAAVIMTAVNPRALFDIGFQLSALATLGLVLLAPPLRDHFSAFCRRRLPGAAAQALAHFIGDAVLISLAAQIMTLPLTATYFGRVSPVAPLANFLILPVQPAILLGGMAMLLAGVLWPPLAAVIAAIPWLFLTYTTTVVRLAAELPFASVALGTLGAGPAIVYYAGLAASLTLWHLDRTGWVALPVLRPPVAVARLVPALALPAVVAAALALSYFAGHADGRLHVWWLPAGRGEVALVVTPAGRTVLVAPAAEPAEAGSADAAALPGWARTVDIALAGATKQPWPAGQTIDPGALAPGEALRLDEGVTLTRLEAAGSWALALKYGQFSTLLPATLSQAAQTALAVDAAAVPLTVLKAAGPGTGAWPAADLIRAGRAQLVLWPQETTYPPAVTALLVEQGAVRIEAGAAVEVVSDGRRYWWRQWAAGPGN